MRWAGSTPWRGRRLSLTAHLSKSMGSNWILVSHNMEASRCETKENVSMILLAALERSWTRGHCRGQKLRRYMGSSTLRKANTSDAL